MEFQQNLQIAYPAIRALWQWAEHPWVPTIFQLYDQMELWSSLPQLQIFSLFPFFDWRHTCWTFFSRNLQIIDDSMNWWMETFWIIGDSWSDSLLFDLLSTYCTLFFVLFVLSLNNTFSNCFKCDKLIKNFNQNYFQWQNFKRGVCDFLQRIRSEGLEKNREFFTTGILSESFIN